MRRRWIFELRTWELRSVAVAAATTAKKETVRGCVAAVDERRLLK